MFLKIEFHDSLIEYTKCKLLEVSISRAEELISFLQNSFPKLRKLINKIRSGSVKENLCLLDEKNNIIALSLLNFPAKFKKLSTIKIVPLVSGGGKAILPIILGIALVAASIVLPGSGAVAAGAAGAAGAGAAGAVGTAGIGALLGQAAFGLGLSLVLSGVSSLIMGKPKGTSGEGQDRVNNDTFDSITNTISTRTPIPLNYGLIRVGGQILSAYLLTERIAANNGKPATTVKVKDYF